MTKTIYIKVEGEEASLINPAEIVCGNRKKYYIEFTFSEEWKEYPHKTARFFYNGKFEEKIFTGNICEVPVMSKITGVFVGVYAGDLATTTPAYIPCKKSILCLGGAHVDPPEDVYNQLMALLNKLHLEKGKPSDELPLMDGEASAGENLEYSRADHVHPTDETRASKKALDEEIERATAAEEANAEAIAAEIARATATEEMLAAAIVTETERATAAEEANAEAIATETERATAAEEVLAAELAEEIERATAAEEANAEAIAAEIKRAKEVESDLANTKQDNLAFDGTYNSETNKVATVETVARKIAEIVANADEDFDTLKELADWLNTHGGEATEMNSAIRKNAEDIATETARATAADQEHAEAIAAETERATAAEEVLAAELAEEIKRATAAENNINNTANSALNIANTSLQNAQIAKTNSEEALEASAKNTKDIAAETERATAAEEVLAAELAEEIERATAAEEANAEAIAAEIERSIAADAILTDKLEVTDTIARGANPAVTYNNYSEMSTALNSLPKDTYYIGQNIMIITLGVPDLWVSAIAEESVVYTHKSDTAFTEALKNNGSVQIGYYILSELETQKVYLNDYVKNTDIAQEDIAGVVRLNNNGGFRLSNGKLYNPIALDANFVNKSQAHFLRPSHYPLIGKYGVAYNSLTLTLEEQAAALNWLTPNTDGTIGLEYEVAANKQGAKCLGIGNSKSPHIVIGSKFRGYTVNTINADAFMGNVNIRSVIVPDSITGGMSGAFMNCTNLNKVILGNGLKYITASAFENCTNLKSIVIPVSVTTIYLRAFHNCNNLTDIYYGGTWEQWCAIEKGANNTVLENAGVHCEYGG